MRLLEDERTEGGRTRDGERGKGKNTEQQAHPAADPEHELGRIPMMMVVPPPAEYAVHVSFVIKQLWCCILRTDSHSLLFVESVFH
uniref:Uncharacterized protein n=1 Tax=Anopheles minimus TaxID=112268 RepID=A0A182WNF5_9DIPT